MGPSPNYVIPYSPFFIGCISRKDKWQDEESEEQKVKWDKSCINFFLLSYLGFCTQHSQLEQRPQSCSSSAVKNEVNMDFITNIFYFQTDYFEFQLFKTLNTSKSEQIRCLFVIL